MIATFRVRILIVSIAMLVALHATAAEQLGLHHWQQASRVVVFADVHGAFDELVALLQRTEVIDEQLTWISGTTHLVSLGDLLDRGTESRKVLDLLMRLEKEALQQGGRFHLALGNHEIMNLTGDLRYVSEGEYSAFAHEENSVIRSAAFTRYLADRKSSSEALTASSLKLKASFDQRYPPGFFAHRSAFSQQGQYGRWLLTKPHLLIINDNLFLHGGISSKIKGKSLDELNRNYSNDLKELMSLRAKLESERCVFIEQDYSAAIKQAQQSTCSIQDVQRFVELEQASIFSDTGVTWYRGNSLCHNILEGAQFDQRLNELMVRRVFVGHSVTLDRQVHERFAGKLVRMDTGMLRSHYRGKASAWIIEGDKNTLVYLDEIQPKPLDGRDSLTEEVLLNGTIREDDSAISATSEVRVQVTYGALSLSARFVPRERKLRNREIAAYRLDQMLGLGLVAVTVAREFRGEQGILVAVSTELISEAQRGEQSLSRPNWCSTGNIYQLMYVFDALIYNNDRNAGNIAYDKRTWQLILSDHKRAFDRSARLPKYLLGSEQALPAGMAVKLRDLSREQLNLALAALLRKAQINGIIKRRDLLLTRWKVAG